MDPIAELRPGITGSRQLTAPIAKIGPLVLAVLWSSHAGRAEEQRPLSVEAALGQLAFASRMPIDVSQDGQYVAYTLEDPQRRQPAGADRFRSSAARALRSRSRRAMSGSLAFKAANRRISPAAGGPPGVQFGPPMVEHWPFTPTEAAGPSFGFGPRRRTNRGPSPRLWSTRFSASRFLSGRRTGRSCSQRSFRRGKLSTHSPSPASLPV